jgi:hypothetical protein
MSGLMENVAEAAVQPKPKRARFKLPGKLFWKRTAAVVAVVYLCFASFVWWAMKQPPETFGRVMMKMPEVAYFLVPFETMWLRARVGHLKPGNAAPDFSLEKLDKSGQVQLSALTAQKPVVLIFGSYT